MYLLKLSLRSWRQSPFSQIFTACAVGILLFLAGFLFWMQRGMGPVIDRLQNEQVITAYLDPALAAQNESQVVESIRTSLGSHAEVQLVGTDQFLSHVRSDYPTLAAELEDLGAEMQSVIPRYVSVTGVLPSGALDQVKAIHGVQSAESSVDRFRNVIGAFRALRWIATLLTCGLALALMTGLLHLGRTNAYLHRGASALMKLMGASPLALRVPALVSGSLVGLLGGVFACGAWIAFGCSVAGHVRSLSPVLSSMPDAGQGFGFVLLAAGLLIGAISGVLGGDLGESYGASERGRQSGFGN